MAPPTRQDQKFHSLVAGVLAFFTIPICAEAVVLDFFDLDGSKKLMEKPQQIVLRKNAFVVVGKKHGLRIEIRKKMFEGIIST
mgnify:CR=1 FL=1